MILRSYYELTKPRLASLVMLSTFVGFFLAENNQLDYVLMFYTLFGTALVAAGSMTLNQWMEADLDAMMDRTKKRPIPAREISKSKALAFGLTLSVLGILILILRVNFYATIIALATTLSYVVLYTPLKTRTSLCTLVGALPGALPPLIGWSAVTGKAPTFEAWILFGIIFLWQMPHFLAIAWLYREDFARAGYKMLSVEDPEGKQVARQMLLYAAALVPVSLMPSVVKMTGGLYFFTALILGLIIFVLQILNLKRMDQMAKPLFRISILYLTLIFILLMVDKI